MPFDLTTSQIAGFFLIFLRIGAMMISAPIFSSPRVPLQLRAGMSLVLALLLQPIVAPDGPMVTSLGVLALLAVREVVVGLIIGYLASLIFNVIEMAGELQDMQAGFGFAGVVDPMMQRSSAILGQFQMVLMWLIFLIANGHQMLLQALSDSFAIVPLGKFTFAPSMATHMVSLTMTIMLIAIRISAPVLGAVLLSDLAMGMLQRTAPQLNIIAVGFPIKIVVAVGVMCISLPFLLGIFSDLVPFMRSAITGMLGG
ncbi:MAG: flagellar biosynthetic protein FliR [Armatimonadota bacterium]